MEYLSLFLSLGVLFFVVHLMFYQKRFDFLNGLTITGALIGVLLDIDSIWTGRKYEITTFIGFGVLLLWFFSQRRKPLENK